MLQQSESIDRLFEAILSLRTREECYRFFEDACTIREIQEIAQRFQVACMLVQKQNYQRISEQTGVSTATISRVNRSLQYGSDGYRRIIERLGEKQGGEQA